MDTLEIIKENEEKFWERVDISGECHEWIAYRSKDGYGAFQFRFHGEKYQYRAHRASYMLKHDVTLFDTEVVRHKCDNRGCVNPDHLVLGTHADNVKDRVQRNRSASGEENGRTKLTRRGVHDIRKQYAKFVTLKAEEYGVDRNTIKAICLKKTW